MSKFISSLCVVVISLSAYSQSKKDTITTPVKKERYGIRVGVDLNKIARRFYTDDYSGLELVADYRLTKKMYIAAELGNEDYTIDDNQVNFTTKGNYLKVGFDYNAYENWLDMENMIYIGLRYGFSSFSQNLNSYTIYDDRLINDNDIKYLDEVTVTTDREYSGLSAHWAEVVGGIKAEVFDNLYLGFSVRLNYLITDKKPENFDNLHISGFNRTYSGSFGAGFNYTVSYFIPLYKKADKPKENK
ncbi:MAG: hypothetical protein BM557_11460 [Flavobacterium sp. MedPE-SWcel]|uniref:DUF6048 family protein n=1 Tax=uncultured Flavobacterium sp. TaxID=165435 RepID=UPI000917ED3A|nr:DUF6048 family protein [uncultured Flavobacterium sp.]OIQ15378.1 MAG: hypothetical protein BM557_11460 [Flavobacterium sp. MedPE-SWcel]